MIIDSNASTAATDTNNTTNAINTTNPTTYIISDENEQRHNFTGFQTGSGHTGVSQNRHTVHEFSNMLQHVAQHVYMCCLILSQVAACCNMLTHVDMFCSHFPMEVH